MGRALKTAKSSTIDTGYPQTTSGVVGGNTSISGSQVLARVKIGTQAEANGYIIRQKGKKKFLVASTTTVNDEDIVANNVYVIASVGTTNWTALGASETATTGDIFTAKINGTGLTTTGTAHLVGVCTLANTANGALTANSMTVTCSFANAATFKAKTLTNHWVTDFSNVKYIANASANGSTVPATVAVALA